MTMASFSCTKTKKVTFILQKNLRQKLHSF